MDIFNNFDFLLKGLFMTFFLAILSISGSLILGIILGVLRNYGLLPFKIFSTLYIETFRSTPLILFIVFIHFGLLPFILGEPSSFFGSSCVALILFTSAYVAEIVRSGFNSIDKSNVDAAISLGLTPYQRLRYIILPIAIARMIPSLTSQFIALIKDTSLASTIGLIEFTRAGEIIYERTYHEFEILLFIAFVYFIICFSLSSFIKSFQSRPNMAWICSESMTIS
jgi:polar amino acid transport system permease protein